MLKEIKLTEYKAKYGDDWADELPANCPPEDVCVAEGDIFYRFTINADCVTSNDWINYLTLYPDAEYTEEKAINAAGLSVCDDLDDAKKQLKLPYIKKQFKGMALIALIPDDGVVKQTSNNRHHYTWWRTKKCDLSKAQIVCS